MDKLSYQNFTELYVIKGTHGQKNPTKNKKWRENKRQQVGDCVWYANVFLFLTHLSIILLFSVLTKYIVHSDINYSLICTLMGFILGNS